jgi:hypothetical protein
MFLDDEEIQIMSTAKQPLLRSPTYNGGYERIFKDFFTGRNFAGTKVLELGPGQCDLLRMMQAAGATVVAMDNDPAIVALAKKRGYGAILGDCMNFDWKALRGTFDGLFAKAVFNPFWHKDPNAIEGFTDNVCSVLKPDGWGWVGPWCNPAPEKVDPTPEHAQLVLETQRQAFKRHGFNSFELDYTVYKELFLRNIDPPVAKT